MSTAAAAEAPPPAKGKKKLLIIIIAVVALVLVGGGVGFMMMSKKKAADAEEGADGHEKAAPPKVAAKPHDPKALPVFVPLEPFTVNLADRDAERFAQIGITLEFTDAKIGEQTKAYMPAIRNNVLMAIADRTAAELLGREGKDRLARKVGVEAARAMGYDVEDDEEDEAAAHSAEGEKKAAPKKKKKKRVSDSPVKAVHFSNFIVQ